jgi:molybdopterin converting factor subunit 1
MRVRIEMFARARELAGSSSVELELEETATVGDLRRRLAADRPALAPLLAKSAIAVDQEFAGDQLSLRHGAVVAVVPPVSGG